MGLLKNGDKHSQAPAGGFWIAPSILSADFGILKEELEAAATAGANWIHVDVMDGHFVPNITMGPGQVKSIRPYSKLPFDCHLMVTHPEQWIEKFARAGADLITFHAEAVKNHSEIIQKIHAQNCWAGISIKPDTAVEEILEVLDEVDLVLVMSVYPGFSGQKFIPDVIPKIKKLKNLKKEKNFLIQVDGGVDVENIKELFEAGADVFVAGSAIFSKQDRLKAINELKRMMTKK